MTRAFEVHDHSHCRRNLIRDAEARATNEGLRLTHTRMRILEMLHESHEALGAYEILSRLVDEGAPAQPPIVYRALNFLTENGFAHRVESHNAYVACQYPNRSHQAGLMICRNCNLIGEYCLEKPIFSMQDFWVETQVVEVEGLCGQCVRAQNGAH